MIDGTGSAAADSSTHGNNGVLNNMNSASWMNGLFGGALWFNGLDTYVSISNVAGGDFTLSCWIKSSQTFLTSDATYEGNGIIWSDVGGVANDFILGGTRSGSGVNRLSLFTGNPDISVNGVTEICTGQWVHLTATRNSATGQLIVYVNGLLDATGTGGTNYLNANPVINIGGNTLDGRYFQGLMDEVRVYSRVLSPGEISSLHQLYLLPAITAQPQNQTVLARNNATFNIIATGMLPFSYQWLFNGTNLSGANGATLTILNALPANAGNYSVVLTSNGGSVTSAVASLTVTVPRPLISNFSTTAGQTFQISGTGVVNQTYIFEATTNLASPAWIPVATNLPGNNGIFQFTDTEFTNHAVRFYRVATP